MYWFDLNLQGDIVAVYSKTGTKLASYSYDPWGYGEVGYVNGGEFSQAKRNRIAYRGYYYDSDLDLYYLQSRYYDPSTKRFISPDTIMSGANGSLQGFNLYAYCFNNPINMTDGQGNWPKWVENAWELVSNSVSSAVSYIENVDFTYSTGPSFSVTLGILGVTYSPTISVDSDGNVAFQSTYSLGFTSSASFGASIGRASMITNAPGVSSLEGPADIVGGSFYLLADKIPVGGGADVNIIPDIQNGGNYFGLSFFAGIATAPGGEVHWGKSSTRTVFEFNIIDLFKE